MDSEYKLIKDGYPSLFALLEKHGYLGAKVDSNDLGDEIFLNHPTQPDATVYLCYSSFDSSWTAGKKTHPDIWKKLQDAKSMKQLFDMLHRHYYLYQ